MTVTETWVLEEAERAVGRIRVVGGPDAGAEHAFEGPSAVIGSGPTAHIELADPTVSRLHCELARDGASVRLRDLGSKNGCFVAGMRVVEALLPPGTRVTVGTTVLEVAVANERGRRARYCGGDRFGAMLGPSAAMQELFGLAARVADMDAPTLIRGESGTGKELLARAIHDAGPRRGAPFVVLDCAALSAGVADVELFGHAVGAFTGASTERAGVFERADGGTLLLDELGELPFELQAKLLRALDRGEVRRIGEAQMRSVDVRAIATTRVPLERRVNEGCFREDLLHRVSGLSLWAPPLRDRGRDAQALAREMAEAAVPEDAAMIERVEREVAGRAGYQWPGNVRELRGFVRRLVALGSAELGAPRYPDLPTVRFDLPFHDAKKEWVERFERQYLAGVLDETGGNVAAAARRAGLNRAHLHELLERLDVPRR